MAGLHVGSQKNYAPFAFYIFFDRRFVIFFYVSLNLLKREMSCSSWFPVRRGHDDQYSISIVVSALLTERAESHFARKVAISSFMASIFS